MIREHFWAILLLLTASIGINAEWPAIAQPRQVAACDNGTVSKRIIGIRQIRSGNARFNYMQALAVETGESRCRRLSKRAVALLNSLLLSDDAPSRFWSAVILGNTQAYNAELIGRLNVAKNRYRNEAGSVRSIDAMKDAIRKIEGRR